MTTSRDEAHFSKNYDGVDAGLEQEDEASDFDPDVERYYANRNILIYNQEGTIVAGLHQRGFFTITNVYKWLAILFHLPQSGTWSIQSREGGEIIDIPSRSRTIFPLGSFHLIDQDAQILSPLPKSTSYRYRCLVNDSRKSTPADDELFNQVGLRDEKCLITGMGWLIYPKEWGVAPLTVCAKIFPFVTPSEWWNSEVQEIFRGMADSPETFAQVMMSPSNSFVCAYMASEGFHHHWFSIDVDDDYRIVHFTNCEQWRVPWDGKLLIDTCEETDSRPSDALLRAHFHQALIHWGLHDPGKHREFIIASKLAFNIQNREEPSDRQCWIREPGKTVLEAYVAQQLLGYCVELGKTSRDIFLDVFGEPDDTEPSEDSFDPTAEAENVEMEAEIEPGQVDDVDSDFAISFWPIDEKLIKNNIDPELIPALDFWLAGS
ncbi:hypothetical protein SISSUDRAFT_1131932 [Sistotremastrum suecicum HHB10207 ss-3]|uniref:HNH nuclease domain-containing protein n=1 Tax=Sistotremastrum suecicum HHB10207 ss-3 TaxID=1314776 RepID=A0A165ZIC4_9AGAM|nr:hypothetical protein SISSUDRAFT_1131932 [Sistotremastrum suecicum HHB10207 ss-3]